MVLLISSYKSNVFQRQHILASHRLYAGLLREGTGRYVLPHMLLTGIMVSYFPFVIGVGYVYHGVCYDFLIPLAWSHPFYHVVQRHFLPRLLVQNVLLCQRHLAHHFHRVLYLGCHEYHVYHFVPHHLCLHG